MKRLMLVPVVALSIFLWPWVWEIIQIACQEIIESSGAGG